MVFAKAGRQAQRFIKLAVTIGLAWTIIGGCSGPARSPAAVIICADVSDQTPTRLTSYMTLVYKFQRQLAPNDHMRVAVFAHGVLPTYTDTPIYSRGRFNQRVGSKFIQPHGDITIPGTQAGLALNELATNAAKSSLRVGGLICTDGGMEDLNPAIEAAIHRSVDQLKRNPNFVGLVVAGVAPEHRTRWETWVAPLGEKAQVRGLDDGESALNALIGRLTGGRT